MTEEEVANLFSRISYTTDLDSLSDADFVFEAIIENKDIKKKVFSELENIVKDKCIIATNTSSLSVTDLAQACKNPSRFLGIHFFNPVPLMKLVEIIPAIQTDQKTVDQALQIIQSWNKTTVITKDTPGFIVNKVARPYYGEAMIIAQEKGANESTFRTIDAAMKSAGFRMGPFELMDYIGNDINYKAAHTVYTSFYNDDRYRPSIEQKRRVEAGYLGRKTGRGWYDYSTDTKG